MTDAIREKVTTLDSVRRELLALSRSNGHAEGDEYRLFPPPAPGEVRAFERRAGRSLPASFRSFLELANGWRGFMRGWTLLGLRRRETELFFREGLDEKILRALPDLVPEAELKSLSQRERTDPKVLSPANHQVVGVDGRGSALVLDGHRSTGGEPEVALVKYVWVQRRWPSFSAFLDEALSDATRDLERAKATLAPITSGKKGAKAAKRSSTRKQAAVTTPVPAKRRVVEIRPSPKRSRGKPTSSAKQGEKREKVAPKMPAKSPAPKRPAPKKKR